MIKSRIINNLQLLNKYNINELQTNIKVQIAHIL